MNVEEILQIIEAVSESRLTEFAYETEGTKLSFKKEEKQVIQAAQAVCQGAENCQGAEKGEAVPKQSRNAASEKSGLSGKNVVSSPLVGTFYAAPSEDAEPFVKVGDHIEKGKVLAIVEAMKLMNEIESDFDGMITEILVQNGDAVEYGQPLFVIG